MLNFNNNRINNKHQISYNKKKIKKMMKMAFKMINKIMKIIIISK